MNMGPLIAEGRMSEVFEWGSNEVLKLARESDDNGSREMLEGILEGEEEHADWLEAQLYLIENVGAERYLAEQIGE